MNDNKQIEQSIIKKYRKTIWSKFVESIKTFELIEDNDNIAVCISGGKDSFLLAKCMQELKKHGKIKFDISFIVMNPGYTQQNIEKIIENAKHLEIPIHIFNADIFKYVTSLEEGSPCYLCARMRRGYLYNEARNLGCNKIALGHHHDDVLETVLLSMLYSGEFKTMMPKLHSDNYPGMELIRPLYFVKEEAIINWKNSNQLEFLNCACKFTENVDNNLASSKRAEIKELIADLRKKSPYIEKNLYKSTTNVNLNTVIGYQKNGQKTHFLETYSSEIHKD